MSGVSGVSAVVADSDVLTPTFAPDAAERNRLMDAALHVMRRNGFQGASVQDILDRAGLSTRAFYRQFRSKDDLLLAMFRTASDPDVDQIARSVAEAPTALGAVLVWVDQMLSLAFDRRRVRRLVIFNTVARHGESSDARSISCRWAARRNRRCLLHRT